MDAIFQTILTNLKAAFDPEVVGEGIAQMIINLSTALIIFLVFFIAWKLLDWIMRPVMLRMRLDATVASFVRTITQFVVLAFGVVSALNAIGINTTALVASIGIAGLTIGFAARDALSNLISGILIFLDRPFVIGDLVEIEGHYGRVEQITLRSTRVVTSDGRMLAVPNSEVINKTVASYTNYPHLRLDIPVSVSVSEDISRVRRLLIEVVAGDEEYLETPPARVVVRALNDYNVGLELQVWLRNEREHVEKRSDLRERVFNAMNRAGVEMPFETIQLAPFEANLRSGKVPAGAD